MVGKDGPITINHCDGNGRQWVVGKGNGRNTMIADGIGIMVAIW